MVRAGTFREDLYFRLKKGVEIHMPPLRDRRTDIPLLVQAFLRASARENGKDVREITREAMESLVNYDWPGNVRELEATIESAVVLCRTDKLTPRDLPQSIRDNRSELKGPAGAAAGASVPAGTVAEGPARTVQEAERQLIIEALKETGGNRTLAAKRVGVSRRTLHRKLHEYQLENL